MKPFIFTILLLFPILGNSSLWGQIIVPYYNNFDNSNDTIGWSHYAISGTDDWELGIPNYNNFTSALSAPNAWVTNLNSSFAGFSDRALETPFFDLTDTTREYALSFSQKRHRIGSGNYLHFIYQFKDTTEL